MKIELVDNWNKLHRAWSVQAASLLVMLLSLQGGINQLATSDLIGYLPQIKQFMASPGYNLFMLLLSLAIVVLRFVSQGLSTPAEPTEPNA